MSKRNAAALRALRDCGALMTAERDSSHALNHLYEAGYANRFTRRYANRWRWVYTPSPRGLEAASATLAR